MDKLGKRERMGSSTLVAATIALALGSIANLPAAEAGERAALRDAPVTLAPDGRMKLTVTGSRAEPVTLLADGRMKLTVVAHHSAKPLVAATSVRRST